MREQSEDVGGNYRMLAFDIADGLAFEGTRTDAVPSLLAHTLGNLVAERMSVRNSGFAVRQLCTALVADGPRDADAYVDRLMECGVTVQTIYDSYIPRAARLLGEWWTEDRVGFNDVTVGMTRLTEIFRRLSPDFLKSEPQRRQSHSALFALCPGENHSLGIAMAADYFQRAGWAVRVELQATKEGLARLAGSGRYDLIGLSAGSRRQIDTLRDTVEAIRTAVAAHVPIIIGGPLVGIERSIASIVGADSAQSVAAAALMEVEKRTAANGNVPATQGRQGR
jgi:methanogenic corrinoid protein MtbC1